jgi:hypothetical protein
VTDYNEHIHEVVHAQILYLDVSTLKMKKYQHTVLCNVLGSVRAQHPAFTDVQQMFGLVRNVSTFPTPCTTLATSTIATTTTTATIEFYP